MFQFDATREDELSLKEGDIVNVFHIYNNQVITIWMSKFSVKLGRCISQNRRRLVVW